MYTEGARHSDGTTTLSPLTKAEEEAGKAAALQKRNHHRIRFHSCHIRINSGWTDGPTDIVSE